MTLKSKWNEEVVQEKKLEVRRYTAKKREKIKVIDPSCNPSASGRVVGEKGEGSNTSQLDEKIIGVEAGLSALSRRIVVVGNNFSYLESVSLEGLDDVKNNLFVLEEVHKEGLTNLELKLTEALSSYHRELEDLKRQVDEISKAGVVAPMTVRDTCIEAPKPKEFRGERSAQDIENFLWKMDAYFEHVYIHSEAAKIRTAAMYLSDTAILWWRRKKSDTDRGICVIND